MMGRSVLLLLLATFLFPCQSSAAPFEWPIAEGGNGHAYEMLEADGMTWAEARTAAESMVYQGTPGHLATMTTEAELLFVFSLSERPTFGAYLGGWQKLSGDLDPSEVYGWRWMTGEAWSESVPFWCGWTECGSNMYLSVTRMPYEGVVYYWESLTGLDDRQHFVVEYDGLPVVDPPEEGVVGNTQGSWSMIKMIYR